MPPGPPPGPLPGALWLPNIFADDMVLQAEQTEQIERLFSQVGIMFDKKRQRGKAESLASGMFAKINL